jgi:hypothetical protein
VKSAIGGATNQERTRKVEVIISGNTSTFINPTRKLHRVREFVGETQVSKQQMVTADDGSAKWVRREERVVALSAKVVVGNT